MGDGGSSAVLHQVNDPIMVMEILSGRRLLPEDFNPTEHSLLSYLDKICILHFKSRNREALPPCTTMFCRCLCTPRCDLILSFQKTFPLRHSLLGQQIRYISHQDGFLPTCPANQMAVNILQNISPPLARRPLARELFRDLSLPP